MRRDLPGGPKVSYLYVVSQSTYILDRIRSFLYLFLPVNKKSNPITVVRLVGGEKEPIIRGINSPGLPLHPPPPPPSIRNLVVLRTPTDNTVENRRFLVLYFIPISQQSLSSIARAHRNTIATSNHAVRPA